MSKVPLSIHQVFLIHHDLGLYDEESQKRPECRALNIPEELGQVSYFFQILSNFTKSSA